MSISFFSELLCKEELQPANETMIIQRSSHVLFINTKTYCFIFCFVFVLFVCLFFCLILTSPLWLEFLIKTKGKVHIQSPHFFQRTGRRSTPAQSALGLEMSHMGPSTSQRVGSFIHLSSFISMGQLAVTGSFHLLIGDVFIHILERRDSFPPYRSRTGPFFSWQITRKLAVIIIIRSKVYVLMRPNYDLTFFPLQSLCL